MRSHGVKIQPSILFQNFLIVCIVIQLISICKNLEAILNGRLQKFYQYLTLSTLFVKEYYQHITISKITLLLNNLLCLMWLSVEFTNPFEFLLFIHFKRLVRSKTHLSLWPHFAQHETFNMALAKIKPQINCLLL